MLFALLNGGVVTLNYYFIKYTISLSLALLLHTIAGLFIGLVLVIWVYLRMKRRIRQIKSELHHVEEELKTIRNMPMQDSH